MLCAAILNSRQSKMPVGDKAWVVSTLKAVRHAGDNGYTIISSVGMNTWELVTWSAGAAGAHLQLHMSIPFRDTIAGSMVDAPVGKDAVAEMILREFELNPARTEFRFHCQDSAVRRKQFWPERDEEIVRLADILYPVSIRSGGNFENLLNTAIPGGKIDRRFSVPYDSVNPDRNHPLPMKDRASACHDAPWPYLTHWTRSANGKWPGETAAAYYRDIIQPGRAYPRSALATLMRILAEKRIRASHWRIRESHDVVSFTALPPSASVKLMRWRKRFVRWNFEPYGIVIRKDAVQAIGLRPVMYGVPGDYKKLSVSDQPFFQNRGVRGGDWTPEHEWRYVGDLDLHGIPHDALKVIVCSPEDVARVRPVTDAEILPLYR